MPAPSWLLLGWSGFAATCVAALTGAIVGGSAPATWSLLPAHRSPARSLGGTLLAGLVLYPLVYGVIFEYLGRADARLGVILGVMHALVALLAALPGRAPHTAVRVALMHALYGLTIAFLYVTP